MSEAWSWPCRPGLTSSAVDGHDLVKLFHGRFVHRVPSALDACRQDDAVNVPPLVQRRLGVLLGGGFLGDVAFNCQDAVAELLLALREGIGRAVNDGKAFEAGCKKALKASAGGPDVRRRTFAVARPMPDAPPCGVSDKMVIDVL